MREEERVIEAVMTVVRCEEAGLCSALVAACNSGWICTYLSEGGIVSPATVWMNDQSLESSDCVSCLATLTTDWEILSPVLSHPVRLLEDVSRWVSWECLWIICLEVRSTLLLSLSGWVLRIGIMWKLRHYYCYFVHPHLCKLWENIRGGGEMIRDDLLVCLQSRWDIRMNFEGISPFKAKK